MSEELKPCPFCGGKAFVTTVEHTSDSRPHGYRFCGRVMCMNCQASAGPTGFDATKEEADLKAIKRWNTRPIEDALRAENAKLKARVEAAEEVFRKQKIYKSYFRNGQLDARAEYELEKSGADDAYYAALNKWEALK